MHGNAAYQYLTVTCTTEETSSIHSTFSKFAKANENWAEISDRAERRRIQNRISQRKYRKKLKKRLEDLERRAASRSASPEQKPTDLKQTQQSPSWEFPYPPHSVYPYTAPLVHGRMFSHQSTRQVSKSPPPLRVSSDSAYTAPEITPYLLPYIANSLHHTIPPTLRPATPSYQCRPSLLSSHADTLQSLVSATKSEYCAEESLSPFFIGYAAVNGIEIPSPDANAALSAHNEKDPSIFHE